MSDGNSIILSIVLASIMTLVVVFLPTILKSKTTLPEAVEVPTITGVGYEAIVGHRLKARVFWNGTEYGTVDDMLEDLGFTGDDLDQQVGGKAMKIMKDFNALDEIK